MSALKMILATAATLMAVTLLSAGCSPMAAGGSAPRDPFTSRIEGGDGIIVEFKGDAHGHRAGEQARFELMLQNNGDIVWQNSYCLMLMNQSGPVATLAAKEFSLHPGAGEERTIERRLPEGLADGCYALALVLPDGLSTTTTITVGEPDGPCTGPWPTPECHDQ